MRCPFKMTSEYESRPDEGKSKTLDDIYRAIVSVDGKVDDVLDELADLEYRASACDDDWSMKDLYDHQIGY